MIFENITENEYEKFWNIYKNRCFLSSIEIGHLREKMTGTFLMLV